MTEQDSACAEFDSRIIVTVPDLPSDGLVARATEVLGCMNLDEEFEVWDFVLEDERGASFEAKIRSFEHRVYSADVRETFLRDGFDGSAAAFLVWVLDVKPTKWYASIPSTPGRLRTRTNGQLCAPCFLGGSVFLTDIREPWSSSWTFVAFRRMI